MRILTTVDRLTVAPGETAEIRLDVVNTETVIEGIGATVYGVPAEIVRTEPASLALFPDAQGELAVLFAVPVTFPAGRHPVTVAVQGSAPGARPVHHDLELVVTATPRLALQASPSVVRARRKGTFSVESINRGNVPLDVSLRARDADRTLTTTVTPSTRTVGPGESFVSEVVATGPRQLFGSERDRPLRIDAVAGEEAESLSLMLRQRPLVSRGLLTVFVLLAVVAVWAAIFLLGIRGVLGGDPVTKVAPASFFAATAEAGAPVGADGAAPAGALSKDGLVEAGVGGTVTGTVVSLNDGLGVGRITVDALRESRAGLVVVGSAATQADGTYTIAGLFPGQYYLRASADGYDEIWFPAAETRTAGSTVRAGAQEVTDSTDLVIVGQPATLSGTVQVGDVRDPVVTTVVARPTWAGAPEGSEYTTTTAADGTFSFTDLPAPGTYELSFTAEGYQPLTTTESLAGGQTRFASDVTLGSTSGQISGMVTDGQSPLGGVEVSTILDGVPVVVGTPTLGAVGTFVIPGLATPGTYVVTFRREGFGESTVVVDLTAGQSRDDLQVVLGDGVGTLTGRLVDTEGRGLGGATVTVGGSVTPVTATTLTSGEVGAFTLTGLAVPGSYTVSFSLPGYGDQSIPLELTAGTQAEPVQVTMSAALGAITGRVTSGGAPVAGAEVVVTDGVKTWTTVAESGGDAPGAYSFSGLAPGTYTVTVSSAGAVTATGLARVTAGSTTTRDLDVTAVG